MRRGHGQRLDLTFLLVLVCFLLSGFAALLYETVWTRQFAFVFGTSELAVATVLAAYMGGLAAGAAVGGRVVGAVTRPILVYGILELGIALAALAVPTAIRASMAASGALFGGRSEPPEAGGLTFALFYLACSFVILGVPTALMGATLPLLTRYAVRRDVDVGPRVGVLYATNTLGAVLGTLVAGFLLIPAVGLRSTVLIGAAVNVVVFAAAAAVARRAPALAAGSPAATATARTESAAGSVASAAAHTVSTEALPRPSATPSAWSREGAILPLILVSGVTSFTYEVLWTRLLGHVLGGSMYAFATMLASFLAGIAAGSALAARLATTRTRAARGFALAQLATALLSWVAFASLDGLPGLAVQLGAGGTGAIARNAVIAGLILFPGAFTIGMTFPFAVRMLARSDAEAATASARVYAWNTLGAIAGAIGSGFFLIPLLGYAGMMAAAIAVNLLLAATVAALTQGATAPLALSAAAALLLLGIFRPATPWKLVGAAPLAPKRTPVKPFFFAVGRSATVSVTAEGGVWRMRVNGLPEGTILPAGQNQPSVLERWLGALPILARPDTRSMLVIGLGAGSALEAVSRTVESIDVIELEPYVIEANRRLQGRRAVDPLAHPRVRLHANDGRGALILTAKRYDAIVSQPSHPWTAGASHLYTREFFAIARDHLTPGGVFVQWIELNFVDDPLLRSLVASLTEIFPHVRMYRPVFRSGILFVASDQPLPVETTADRAIGASPDELAWAGVQTAEDVAAALALDESGTKRYGSGARPITDDENLLQTRSPGILAAPLGSAGADRILASLDPLPAVSSRLDRLYLVRRLLADQYRERAERFVATLEDPTEQLVGMGLLALAAGRASEGAASLARALRLAPDSAEARGALLRLNRDALVGGRPDAATLAEGLHDPAAAVVEGWRAETAKDWQALAALEPRLAAAPPHHPLYTDAFRLRATWRIQSADPARGKEALAIMDRVLPLSAVGTDRAMRATAASVAALGGTAPPNVE